jgi:hypothetical protein
MSYELRQAGLCTADVSRRSQAVSEMRCPLSWRAIPLEVELLGPCLVMAFAQLNYRESLRDIES